MPRKYLEPSDFTSASFGEVQEQLHKYSLGWDSAGRGVWRKEFGYDTMLPRLEVTSILLQSSRIGMGLQQTGRAA